MTQASAEEKKEQEKAAAERTAKDKAESEARQREKAQKEQQATGKLASSADPEQKQEAPAAVAESDIARLQTAIKLLHIPVIQDSELKQQEDIGAGGYGVVYKGVYLPTNETVRFAVFCLLPLTADRGRFRWP